MLALINRDPGLQRRSDCGVLSPKWSIHITPLSTRLRDIPGRGGGESGRARGRKLQGGSVFWTQQGSCT